MIVIFGIENNLLIIFSSFSSSNELVGSSNIKIEGFKYIARAMPILCNCPPEILDPSWPIHVFILLGMSSMNLLISDI